MLTIFLSARCSEADGHGGLPYEFTKFLFRFLYFTIRRYIKFTLISDIHQYQIPSTQYQIPSTQYQVPNTKYGG
jgi:hypothetical protein